MTEEDRADAEWDAHWAVEDAKRDDHLVIEDDKLHAAEDRGDMARYQIKRAIAQLELMDDDKPHELYNDRIRWAAESVLAQLKAFMDGTA